MTGYILATVSDAGTLTPLPSCSYFNGPNNDGVGASLTGNANGRLICDGWAVNPNSRLLPMGEANPATNGPYLVANPGDDSHPFVLIRAPWFNCPQNAITGIYGIAEESATLGNTRWLFVNPGTVQIGTTPIHFTQFTGGPLDAGWDWAENSCPRHTGQIEFQAPPNGRPAVFEARSLVPGATAQYGPQVDCCAPSESDDLWSVFDHDHKIYIVKADKHLRVGNDLIVGGKITVNGVTWAPSSPPSPSPDQPWTPIDASGASLPLTGANCLSGCDGARAFIAGGIIWPVNQSDAPARWGGNPFAPGATTVIPAASSVPSLNMVQVSTLGNNYVFANNVALTNRQLSGAAVFLNGWYPAT